MEALALALARDHESWPGGESRSARLSAARPIPAADATKRVPPAADDIKS